MYNEDYITFPRDNIARLTDLFIKVNKRNGRTQENHLKGARALQSIDYPNMEWRYTGGRPTKEDEIRKYLYDNPSATKAEIRRELGITYPTIRKYYDIIKAEIENKDNEGKNNE